MTVDRNPPEATDPYQLEEEGHRLIAAGHSLLSAAVAARAARRSGDHDFYTSAKAGPHPDGKSARWCRDHFRLIPGARKAGRDWVVARAAYERWAAAQTAPRRRANVVPLPADRAWSATTALAAANLRGGDR